MPHDRCPLPYQASPRTLARASITAVFGAAAAAIPAQSHAVIAWTTPWRTDARNVTIAPYEGVELKAAIKAGDGFVFAWTATGPVKMDMHGETSMTLTLRTTGFHARLFRPQPE